jgi:siroheme synthase
MPGQNLAQVATSLARSGIPAAMPCVAVTDVSRPAAAYTASRLTALSNLPPSSAPTLLLVGHVFEALLTPAVDPEQTTLDHLTAVVTAVRPD